MNWSQLPGAGRVSAAADCDRGWYLKCPRESPSTVYTDLQESKIIDRALAKENRLDRKEQSSKAKKAAKQRA